MHTNVGALGWGGGVEAGKGCVTSLELELQAFGNRSTRVRETDPLKECMCSSLLSHLPSPYLILRMVL